MLRARMNHELSDIKDLARRNNPDFSQVTGLIDKDLARRLRVYCADQGVTIAEVMEESLRDYLEKKQSQQNEPQQPSPTSALKTKRGKAS
jgi:hypothetical protein